MRKYFKEERFFSYSDYPMGKKDLSDEDILKYLSEGWHFHPKDIGKYRYIITRRKQKTKSHGRFNDSDWKRIQELRKKWLEGKTAPVKIREENDTGSQPSVVDVRTRRANRYFKIVRAMQEKLKIYRATYMFILCEHNKEGYCTFWKYSENQLQTFFGDYFHHFMDSRDKDAKQIIGENGDAYWVTRAIDSICTDCPAFL
jgi:hypothetical protein